MTVLCNGFAELGIDVTLIVQQDTRKAYPLDERVHLVGTPVSVKIPVLRSLLRGFKLRKQLKALQPDIIVSFLTWMNIVTIVHSAGLKIPVIVSERNDPASDGFFYKLLRRLVYPCASGFVFQTKDAQAYFSEKIQQRSVVIYNPIMAALPAETKVRNPHRVVAVGRLEAQKNYPLLFRAFSTLPEAYTLDVYGSGSLREEFVALLSELKLGNRVTLHGSVPDVLEQIKDAAVYVLPSSYEGMPNALIEAMAVGLPCIATDCPCGGVRALVKDRENGLLVPVNDEKALSAAMLELLQDTALQDRLSHNAKEIKTTLSADKIRSQWLEYIQQVIKKH
ncbi:Glycosyltransferase involved in cell wall bisynthesis [Acetanaerobacterium elongatum]|uniref:Glycosyltransferase involved in cell wall bisynthesis n=2 Tax=Acetanaerobacterium elongatum TaxID=258515 RepID=A0A1G9Z3Q9_9FIRM|nr:Glycosyltransferase involved in cell wall bisynthesis [Acetanaerobacterium elongatum]